MTWFPRFATATEIAWRETWEGRQHTSIRVLRVVDGEDEKAGSPLGWWIVWEGRGVAAQLFSSSLFCSHTMFRPRALRTAHR
jgi:hypothetical protein